MTTCDNLWQLVTTCDNLWHLVTTWDNLWQLVMICDKLWWLRSNWATCWHRSWDTLWHLLQLVTTRNNLWQLVTTSDDLGQLVTTWDNLGRIEEHVDLERFRRYLTICQIWRTVTAKATIREACTSKNQATLSCYLVTHHLVAPILPRFWCISRLGKSCFPSATWYFILQEFPQKIHQYARNFKT